MQPEIIESHLVDSPRLMAIAMAAEKGRPFIIDGFEYELAEYQPLPEHRPTRVRVTMRITCTASSPARTHKIGS